RLRSRTGRRRRRDRRRRAGETRPSVECTDRCPAPSSRPRTRYIYGVPSVGITGVSGLVGRALTDRLVDRRGITRVVGIDVREPPPRFHGVEFHLADVAHGDLRPLLEGCDVVVHLASIVDPIPDEALMARVNVDGTRRVLEAAGAVGVTKVVRV